MSAIQNIYLYDHVWQLMAIDDYLCLCKDQGPMNNNIPLKAHKGLDNKLIFRVLGPDRAPVDIACAQQVYARIIDPDNNKVVFEKLCRLGPAKGLITLELNSGDIDDLHFGLYNMVLIRTQNFVLNVPDYYIERPLYSDFADNVALKLEITDQAFKAPRPAVVITPDNWTPDKIVPTFGPPMPCFYTQAIPGGRILNHKESVHTFSTYTVKATGILEIWGSLEETPEPYLNAARWCKIYPTTMSSDIEYINYTGTQAWTFKANFMWIKFRWFPSQDVLNPGVLEKLIVRT